MKNIRGVGRVRLGRREETRKKDSRTWLKEYSRTKCTSPKEPGQKMIPTSISQKKSTQKSLRSSQKIYSLFWFGEGGGRWHGRGNINLLRITDELPVKIRKKST